MNLGTIFKLDNGIYIVDEVRKMITRPNEFKFACTKIGGDGLPFVYLYPKVITVYKQKGILTILRN